MQNLTFYKDFQLYILDVQQDRKFYSKALKKEVDFYPCSKGTMILIDFKKYYKIPKVACALGSKACLRTGSGKQ